MEIAFLAIITAASFIGVYLIIRFLHKKADERRGKAIQAAFNAHLRRIRLLQQCADLDRDFWEAKRNISHDCTVIDRDQAN